MEPYSTNIITVVDVIDALSHETLEDNIWMMDTDPYSHNKGAPGLITRCHRGKKIYWYAYAVDLQTPLNIRGITILDLRTQVEENFHYGRSPIAGNGPRLYFDPRNVPHALDAVPGKFFWEAVIPYWWRPGRYNYRLELQIGSGPNSILYTDLPALDVVL